MHTQHVPRPRVVAVRHMCSVASLIRLAVERAAPGFAVVAAHDDESRCLLYPLAVVGTAAYLASLLAFEHNKAPRLAVAGRGSEACGVKNGADESAVDRSVFIFAAAVARVHKLGELCE